MVLEFDLISEESTDTTETLNELETFLRFICNKFNFATKAVIVIAEPFSKW